MPSEKVLEAKKAKVEQLTETLKNAVSFVIVDYKGITVEEDTKLRRDLRAENVKYSVEKNSLLRFALKNAGIEGLDDVLEGTTAIAVSNEDQTAPARVLFQFAQTADKLQLKGGVVDGTYYDENGIKVIATIPSRDELLSKFLGSIQSPVTNFARVLKQIAEKNAEA